MHGMPKTKEKENRNVGCHLDARQGTRNVSGENRGVYYINDAF